MLVVGAAPDAIEVSPIQLIMGKKNIQGWYSGTAMDSEDTLRFAEISGVRPMIEKVPLAKAARGLCPDDERPDEVPRRPHHVRTSAIDRAGTAPRR